MPLLLEYRAETSIPIEVEGIVPDRLAQLPLDQIRRLPIYHGNRELPLAELFDVSGDAADGCLQWQGNLSGVHWIGAKMTSGHIEVHGPAGRHVGSEMRGGRIDVFGDAGDWVGGELHGGLIHVRGSAGHLVGAAYRGSRRGMTGGTILVEGNVGNEIGHTMRRGLLVVGGDAGDLIAFNMLAGSVLVVGDVGIRHGAGMRRGTIGLMARQRPELLPSFQRGCRFRPLAMVLLLRHIAQLGFSLPDGIADSDYELYHGDLIEGGRGEILLRCHE